jgi:hypothetical protein
MPLIRATRQGTRRERRRCLRLGICDGRC